MRTYVVIVAVLIAGISAVFSADGGKPPGSSSPDRTVHRDVGSPITNHDPIKDQALDMGYREVLREIPNGRDDRTEIAAGPTPDSVDQRLGSADPAQSLISNTSSPENVSGGPTLPDLIVQSSSRTPAAVCPGDSVSLTDVVRNQGTVPAGPFFVTWYISADATVTTSDYEWGWRFVSGLASGATSGGAGSLSWPATGTHAQPGTRFIAIIVDDTNSVVESNEGNNLGTVWAVTVNDCTVPDIRVSPNPLPPFSCLDGFAAAASEEEETEFGLGLPGLEARDLLETAGRTVVNPIDQIDTAEVVESQTEVLTAGMTYEEYLERQGKLNNRLVEGMPPEVLQSGIIIDLDEDELDSLIHPRSVAPLQIGVVKPVSPNVQVVGLDRSPQDNDAVTSMTSDGGVVWSLRIASPGAGAIRVHVENLFLPPNVELYFYSLAGEAFGPYTGTGPNGTGEFWTESVFGSEGILQLHVFGPTNDAALRRISLSVTEVGHIGERFAADLAPVTAAAFCGNVPCIVDASCFTGANAIKDAIAKMEWPDGQFIFTCTTGLIADTDPSTVKHYCLTAHHCLSTNSAAQNIQFYWRFRTMSCNGACPTNSGWPFKTTGATLRATGTAGDFTLLEANTAPPAGSVYMGFTNVPVANTNGAALHRVSNPGFGPQVYSEHTVDTSAGTCSGLPRGQIIYSRDTLGATDGGSSGSPVVNASNQVVGQLFGSCGPNPNDACDTANATIDGALAHYWTSVQPFLDPVVVSCSGQFLTIFNDGLGALDVSSISKPSWVQLNPPPPFQVSAGQSRQVCVTVDCAACAGTDLDGNLTVFSNDPDETPSVAVHLDCPLVPGPTVTKWESVLTHSPNKPVPVALEIPDTGLFSEPRSGIELIVVTFDGPINPATGIPANVTVCGNDVNNSPVDLSGVVVSTATTAGDTQLEINFTPGLPDFARYRIVLSTNIQGASGGPIEAGAGGLSRILTALQGDAAAGGDRRVNATDIGGVRGLVGVNPIDSANLNHIRADANNDGRINATDLGLVRGRVGQDARAILDPVCP